MNERMDERTCRDCRRSRRGRVDDPGDPDWLRDSLNEKARTICDFGEKNLQRSKTNYTRDHA